MTLEDTLKKPKEELEAEWNGDAQRLPMTRSEKDAIKAQIRTNDYLSLIQIWLLLDCHPSYETVRKWVIADPKSPNKKILPHFRILGGNPQVKLKDFDEFIASNKIGDE